MGRPLTIAFWNVQNLFSDGAHAERGPQSPQELNAKLDVLARVIEERQVRAWAALSPGGPGHVRQVVALASERHRLIASEWKDGSGHRGRRFERRAVRPRDQPGASRDTALREVAGRDRDPFIELYVAMACRSGRVRGARSSDECRPSVAHLVRRSRARGAGPAPRFAEHPARGLLRPGERRLPSRQRHRAAAPSAAPRSAELVGVGWRSRHGHIGPLSSGRQVALLKEGTR